MAIAQDIHYVPWANISEWKEVRVKILSSDIQDLIRAYETIVMWKFKYHNIPAYIECTSGILQVMIQEYKQDQDSSDLLLRAEEDLRLTYSTALIRFVNHVSSVSALKCDTLYLAAKSQNIPDWIINLRHDAAHHQTLPPLDALHIAANFCLKWLLDNYWVDEEHFMEEFVPSSTNFLDQDESGRTGVILILKQSLSIWKLCKENLKYKYLADLPTGSCSLLEELCSKFDMGNKKHVKSVKLLFEELKVLLRKWKPYDSKKDLTVDDRKQTSRVRVLKSALLTIIENISKKHKLSEELVSFLMNHALKSDIEDWLEFIHVIQRVGGTNCFLQSLFDLLGSGKSSEASEWLEALAPAIKSLRKKWKALKKLQRHNCDASIRSVKEAVNEMISSNSLNLDICEPPVVHLEMLKQGLMNPDGSSALLHQYLKIVTPKLPETTKQMIKTLTTIYNGGVVDDLMDENEEPYTLKDVTCLTEGNEENPEEAEVSRKWKRSELDVEAWKTCALGLLPHQLKVDCELPSGITWRVKSRGIKRHAGSLVDHVSSMKRLKTDFSIGLLAN